MVFPEVYFYGIIVDKVLLATPLGLAVTDMTPFVLVSAMCEKLVVAIKALSTKAAFRMSSETALVNRARIVVSKLLVLSQLGECEKFVLVRKDFLVPRTEITTFNVSMLYFVEKAKPISQEA
jgi:hypothetical protein